MLNKIKFLVVVIFIFLSSCSPNINLDTFSVTFNSLGGTEVQDLDIIEGNKIEEPVITKEGHTLVGWFTANNEKWDFEDFEISSDLILYAIWEINTYTITFDSNGGSYVENISNKYNYTVSAPDEPYLEGHTFLGWYTDLDFENLFTFERIKENITLYAKWNVNTYTIEFVMLDETIVTTQKFGELIEFPEIPNEFHFEGWFYDSNMTSFFNLEVVPAGNIRMYAKMIYEEIVKDNDSLFEIYFETVNNNYFSYSNNELMLIDMNFKILKTFDISDYSDQLPNKSDAIKNDEFIYFFTRLCNSGWPDDSYCGDGDRRYLLQFDHNLNLIDTFNYWSEGYNISQYQIIDFTMDESYSKIYFLEVKTSYGWVCNYCSYEFLGVSLRLYEYNLSTRSTNNLDTITDTSNNIFEHKIAFHKDYLLIVSNNLIMKYTFDGTLIRSESIAIGDNNVYPVKAEIYKEKYLILITGVLQRYNAKLRIFELDNLSLIHTFTDIVSYNINQDLLYLLSKQGIIYNVDDSFNLLELISVADKMTIFNSNSDFNVNFFIDSYQTFVLSAYRHSYRNIKVYIQSKSSELSVGGSNPS